MNSNVIAQLERIAVAKGMVGKSEQEAKVWSKIYDLQKDKVMSLLKAIDCAEGEIVYQLQHEQGSDQQLKGVLAARAYYIKELEKHAMWLARHVATTWVNENCKEVVECALKACEVVW